MAPYYDDDFAEDLQWSDDEEYLDVEDDYPYEPASVVYRVPHNAGYETGEEVVPWFMFGFPGPRVVVGIVVAFVVGLALFLNSVTSGWKPGVAPASAAQPQSGVAVVIPDAAAAEESAFVASAEAAAAPCEVSGLFPKKVLRWCNLISYYARHQNLDPDLIAALVWLESGGNEVAYSRSGAVGLMQVMPKDGLAASFMCINGPCFSDRPSIAELENPEFNIKYGTRMLARLLNRHGDVREALKSYGPMNVGYYYADKVLGLFNQYGQTP